MQITVRYFAAARELAGREQEVLTLDGARLTGREVVARIGHRHPRLARHLPSMRLACNEELASLDDYVADGDEVVILPPVAGG